MILIIVMKKNNTTISNPDELNKHLQHTSFGTWLILGIVIVLLGGFFAWSILYKLQVKIKGTANINEGEVTLNMESSSLEKLEVGQKVYIEKEVGTILSFDEDGQPIVSSFSLDDGDYPYYVVIKEMKPIDFLIG